MFINLHHKRSVLWILGSVPGLPTSPRIVDGQCQCVEEDDRCTLRESTSVQEAFPCCHSRSSETSEFVDRGLPPDDGSADSFPFDDPIFVQLLEAPFDGLVGLIHRLGHLAR